MKKIILLCAILVMLLLQSSLASAQSQDDYHPRGLFFNLMFSLIVTSGNGTADPISPGETREVDIIIVYTVTRGALGRLLLQILEGKSFPFQLSIEDKPDWCEAWIFPENMTGVIPSDSAGVQNSSLFIHLNNDAPSNYTLGYVKIRATADSMKGPLKLLTLIQGYEHQFTLSFITGP